MTEQEKYTYREVARTILQSMLVNPETVTDQEAESYSASLVEVAAKDQKCSNNLQLWEQFLEKERIKELEEELKTAKTTIDETKSDLQTYKFMYGVMATNYRSQFDREQRIKDKEKQIKKQIARYDIYDCMSIANGTILNKCVEALIKKKYINEKAVLNNEKYSNCKWNGTIQDFAVFCKVVANELFLDKNIIYTPFIELFNKNKEFRNKNTNKNLSNYALTYDITSKYNQKFPKRAF